MNNVFNNQNQQSDIALIERQYGVARYDLLAIIIFSVINIFLTVFGQDVYFLFSAYLPYSLVLNSSLLTGRWPDEVYKEAGLDLKEFWGADYATFEPLFGAIFGVVVVFALAILGFYLLCYFLSKKRPAWMIVATAVFGIDTLLLIADGLSGAIVDLIFHVVILVIMIRGCIYGRKLKAYNDAMAAQNGQSPYGYAPGFGANGDPYYGNGQYMQNGQPNQFYQNQNSNGEQSAPLGDQQNPGYTEFTPTSYNPDFTADTSDKSSGNNDLDGTQDDSSKKDGTL